MSEERESGTRGRSSGRAWAIVLALAPILYVLSFPPLMLLAAENLGVKGAMLRRERPPVWVVIYAFPYYALSRVPGLNGPMQRYAEWWREKISAG